MGKNRYFFLHVLFFASRHSSLVTRPPFTLLCTSFRALFITRIEVKKGVIYTAEVDRYSSNKKARATMRLN